MSVRPQCLNASVSFPYKEEIESALAAGAPCRKDDRGLLAGQLVGTYQIRLRIAQDPKINGGIPESSNLIARDFATIVTNLSVDPNAPITVYYIGPAEQHIKYVLMEHKETGCYVGCLCGQREEYDG